MTTFYHRTTAASAKKIMRSGFRDAVGYYGSNRQPHRGVWLSNVPLDIHEGADGDSLLRIELPEQAVADCEWIEEGKPYREWLVPAQRINGQNTGIAIVDEDEGRESNLRQFLAALDKLGANRKG
jgi:hypothetical protein